MWSSEDLERFVLELRDQAVEHDIMLWEDRPDFYTEVSFPPEATESEFFDVCQRLGASIAYLEQRSLLTESGDHVLSSVVVTLFVDGVAHNLKRATRQWDEHLRNDGLLFRETVDDEEPSGMFLWGGTPEDEVELSEEQEAAIPAIVADPEFDPEDDAAVVAVIDRHLAALEVEEFAAVRSVAADRFSEEVEPALDLRAQRLAGRLVKSPHLDPLAYPDVLQDFVIEHGGGELEPRLVRRVVAQLRWRMDDEGLHEKALQQLEDDARAILEALDPLERDQLGFSGRWVSRMQILEARLTGVPEHRVDRLAKEVVALEASEYGPTRERRYGTAARVLVEDFGESRAAAARILGITANALARVTAAARRRVALDVDDPLRSLDDRL